MIERAQSYILCGKRRTRIHGHHIVEGQHFADVDFTGQLPTRYAEALPCVLIAHEEHAAYNRDAYAGDHVLTTIALNVLDDALVPLP